jgi:hypothetical protein
LSYAYERGALVVETQSAFHEKHHRQAMTFATMQKR